MTDVIHVCRFPSQAVHILYYPQPRQIGTLWPKTKSRDFYLRSPAMTLQTKWTRTMSTLQESLYTLLQALKKQGFCSGTKGSFNSLTRISFSSSCSTVVVAKTRVFPRVSIPGTLSLHFNHLKRQWGEFSAATSAESSTIYCLQLSAQFPIELEAFYSFITPQGNRHGCTPTLVQPIAFFWIISMYFHKHHIAWP